MVSILVKCNCGGNMTTTIPRGNATLICQGCGSEASVFFYDRSR